MNEVEPRWDLGDPVWWQSSDDTRFSGTVLRREPEGDYLVTLHDHPEWRWVSRVPFAQLTAREDTPELVVSDEHGRPVTTWTCPWPGHVGEATVTSHACSVEFARQACARYMPPLGHAHSSRTPVDLLPEEGVDPLSVPVWTGGSARP